MKKYLAIICAAMLCVCCLAFAACSNGGGSASASGSSAASSSSVSVEDQAVGTWKLAAMEYQNITIAGDFSMFLGSDDGLVMKLDKGGTGTLSLGSTSSDITWEATDKGITIKGEKSDSSSSSASASSTASGAASLFSGLGQSSSSEESLDATIADGVMTIKSESDGQEISMFFTADGTYEGAMVIDMDKADAITSADELVGTWELTGANVMGVTMYGDAKDIASAFNGSTGSSDMSITFDKDGTGKFAGDSFKWSVDSKGAKATISGQDYDLKMIGDNLAFDMGAAIGMDMVMVFSK